MRRPLEIKADGAASTPGLHCRRHVRSGCGGELQVRAYLTAGEANSDHAELITVCEELWLNH